MPEVVVDELEDAEPAGASRNFGAEGDQEHDQKADDGLS
jgi:hypothetical protein